MKILSFILGVGGFSLLYYSAGGWTTLAVFLILWGNNLAHSRKLND